MSGVGRLAHQAHYDLLVFSRNPAALFFSVLTPAVAYLVIGFLASGNDPGSMVGFTAALLAFAVVGVTFVNLAMSMTIRRERGLLKRLRTAPLSPWLFVLSTASVGLVVALAMMVLMLGAGVVLFDLPLTVEAVLLVAVTVLLAVVCFVTMGLALSAFIPSEEAAPSMVQGIALPLYFISGVLVPMRLLPDWVAAIGRVFPVYHFVRAADAALNAPDGGIPFGHWAVMAAWGAVAAVFVARRFRWVPNR